MYSQVHAEPTYDELYEENLALLEEKELLLEKISNYENISNNENRPAFFSNASEKREKKHLVSRDEEIKEDVALSKMDETMQPRFEKFFDSSQFIDSSEIQNEEIQNCDKRKIERMIHRAASSILVENDSLRKQIDILEDQIQVFQKALSSVALEKDNTETNYFREMSALELLEIRNNELQSLLNSANNQIHSLSVQRDHLKGELQRLHLDYQEKFESMHFELEKFKSESNMNVSKIPEAENGQENLHMFALLSKERQEKEQLDAENTELAILADCLHQKLAEEQHHSHKKDKETNWLESNQRDHTIRKLLEQIESLKIDLYSRQDVFDQQGSGINMKGLICRNKQVHTALHMIKDELHITCAKLSAHREANNILSAACTQSKIDFKNVLENASYDTSTTVANLIHVNSPESCKNAHISLDSVITPKKSQLPSEEISINSDVHPTKSQVNNIVEVQDSRENIRSVYFGLKLLQVILDAYQCEVDPSLRKNIGAFHRGAELMNLYLRGCGDQRNVEINDVVHAYHKICNQLDDLVSEVKKKPTENNCEGAVPAKNTNEQTHCFDQPCKMVHSVQDPCALVDISVALSRALEVIRDRENENMEANKLCNQMGGCIAQFQIIFASVYALNKNTQTIHDKSDKTQQNTKVSKYLNTSEKTHIHRNHEQALWTNSNDIEGDLRSRILYLELWKLSALSRIHRLQSELEQSVPVHLHISHTNEVQALRRHVIQLINENTVLRSECVKSDECNLRLNLSNKKERQKLFITDPALKEITAVDRESNQEIEVLQNRLQMVQRKNIVQDLEIKRLRNMDKLKALQNLNMKNDIAELEKERDILLDRVQNMNMDSHDSNLVGKLHREICSLKSMYHSCVQRNHFLHRHSRRLSKQLCRSKLQLDSAVESRAAIQEQHRLQIMSLRDSLSKAQETSFLLRSHLSASKVKQNSLGKKISKNTIMLLDQEPPEMHKIETDIASSIARATVKFKYMLQAKNKALNLLKTDAQNATVRIEELQLEADRAHEESRALRILVDSHKWILEGRQQYSSLNIQQVLEAFLDEMKILKVCTTRKQYLERKDHNVCEEMDAEIYDKKSLLDLGPVMNLENYVSSKPLETFEEKINVHMMIGQDNCKAIVPYLSIYSLDPRVLAPIAIIMKIEPLCSPDQLVDHESQLTLNTVDRLDDNKESTVKNDHVIQHANTPPNKAVSRNQISNITDAENINAGIENGFSLDVHNDNYEGKKVWRDKAALTIASLHNVVRAKDRMLARTQLEIQQKTNHAVNENHSEAKYLAEKVFQEDESALGKLRGMIGLLDGSDSLCDNRLNASLNQIVTHQLESITTEANEMRELNRVLEKRLRKESAARSRAESRWHSGLTEIDNLKKDILILTKEIHTSEKARAASSTSNEIKTEINRLWSMLRSKERKIESLRCALLKLKTNLPRIQEASLKFNHSQNTPGNSALLKYNDHLIEVEHILTSMLSESAASRAEVARSKKKNAKSKQQWNHICKEIDIFTHEAKSAQKRARALESVLGNLARGSA